MAPEKGLEPVLRQIEREREEPADALPETAERVEVRFEKLPQARRVLRPAEAGHRGAPVERLLQVAGRLLAEARREALAQERPVDGQAERRLPMRERELLVRRPVEEAAGGLGRALDQPGGDA